MRSKRALPDDAYEALFLYAADEPYENLIREREKPEIGRYDGFRNRRSIAMPASGTSWS